MGVVKNLMVRAGADFSAITKQANKAKASMKGMQTSVSKSCSLMTSAASTMKKAFGVLGVTISAAAIVSFSKEAKAAYDEQAEASAKLAQVMRNTMGARSSEIKSIEDLIDAQERLGVVSGDIQTEGAQELATYLTLSSSLKTLIPVLNDMVAQQYGMKASAESAVSIATMMGKVMNGQVSALSRYGYSFTEAQESILKYGNEAQRAAVLAEVVSESVGGMNAALAATPAGRLQQVSNTLGNIQESFGEAVNNVLVLFVPALNVLCGVLANVATLANKVAQTLANVFGSSSSKAATTVSYTGAVASSMEDVEDAATSAGKAMSSVMGFDELNKLNSSSGGTEATAGSGAGVGEITESTDAADEAGESIGWLEARLTALKEKFASINTGNLTDALSQLKEAVSPLTQGLFSGLSWAMDNIFVPLAGWAVEDALPAFLEVLASAADLLSAAIEALSPWGTWLWENFLQPLASWTGGVIVDTLSETTDLLHDLADVISGEKSLSEFFGDLTPAQTAIAGIATSLATIATLGEIASVFAAVTGFVASVKALEATSLIGKLAEVILLTASGAGTLSEAMKAVFGPGSIIAGIGMVIGGAVMAVTNFISMLKDGFSWANEALMLLGVAIAAVGAIILGAPALVAGVVAAIVALIASVIAGWDGIKTFFVELWANIKSGASAAWDGIKNVWGNVTSWFSTKVIQPVSNGFKNFANGIISFFEGIVNGGISGVNKLIAAINKISFNVPSWVPVIGGKTFGFNLRQVSSVKLPRLATGAVIPPNNEFAAILGDQTSGMNIETPESLLRSIFREENDQSEVVNMLSRLLSAVKEGKVLSVDRKVLGKIMRSELANGARGRGTDPIPV